MKKEITVISLGPGDASLLTLQSAEVLKNAKQLILRTEKHRTVSWLHENGIPYITLDLFYDRYDDFDEMHRSMAYHLWHEVPANHIVYAVIDASNDESVRYLYETKPAEGIIRTLPGVTRTDACTAELSAGFRSQGLRILPATQCLMHSPEPSIPLLVTEINTKTLAGDIKLWLDDIYDDDMAILFYPSTAKMNRRSQMIPLADLDRQPTYDHTVCAYIPVSSIHQRSRYDMNDLVSIVSELRGPAGCPWDRQQTHLSLRANMLEEASEAVSAIDENDTDLLYDELGDVLLQVVLHAGIAGDCGEFTLTDVTSAICEKMIRRHPQVFSQDNAPASQIIGNWDDMKQQENGFQTKAEEMHHIAKALPALMYASKVQKKAASIGFDWSNAADALPKIHEEADEVAAELAADRDPGEELGDLFFSCVNVARLCGKEPELILREAVRKFVRRFEAMENLAASEKKDLKCLTLKEMDVYWCRVKAGEKSHAFCPVTEDVYD